MKTKILLIAWAGAAMMNSWVGAVNFSPIQFLPGDTAIGPAYQDQYSPSIAGGAGVFLAVWADQRAIGSGSDIYAARLRADGSILGGTSFVVSQTPGDQVMPRVVWNGSSWLVVWQSQEPTQSYWATQVLGARVSPEGVVLDSSPIRIAAFQNSQTLQFSAASDGTNWLIVTEGSSVGESSVLGFRVSPDGQVLDSTGVVILPETYYQRYGLEVGFAVDEFFFLWTEWNALGLDDVYALRLTSSLQKKDASPIVVAASADYDVHPRVASDGTNFFVTYERYNTCCGEGGRVFGTRVTHQGQVQDLAGLDISGDVGISTGRRPTVAWDGSNWFVAWIAGSLSIARVSPSGVVLNQGGLAVDPAVTAIKEEPEIAATSGGGVRVVWTDYRAGSYNPKDIFSAPVAANGQPAPGTCISVGAPSQIAPRLAQGGNGYLAVFLSGVSRGQRVLAQRLDSSGNPLDPQPLEIAPVGPNIYSPAVAGNGSMYLVVWEDRSASTVYGKRVQSNGTILDSSPVQIMRGNTPDVAALGDIFLVVDTHAPLNPQNRFVFAARVRCRDGAVLDASPLIIGGNFALIPRVTAWNDRWLAVWEGHPTHDDTVANIYGAIVTTNGTAQPQFAVTLDGYYVRFHNRPAVSASGTNALVVWTDPRFGNSDWGIFGRRVLPDGTVLDQNGSPPSPRPPLTMPATYPGFALTTATNNQDQPAVAWTGQEYVAVWEDQRANTFFLDQRTDIFSTRVAGDGTVLDPAGLNVADSNLPEIQPAVAGANGTTVYASALFQDQPPYGSYRVGVRTASAVVVLPPVLNAARTGMNLVLSWNTNALGFLVQSCPVNGAGVLAWSTLSQGLTISGTNYVVTVPMTGSGALFRLVGP